MWVKVLVLFYDDNHVIKVSLTCQDVNIYMTTSLVCLLFIVQSYKYRDLTVREITNVISQYKDLKPVMDGYGKFNDNYLLIFDSVVIQCAMLEYLSL